MANQVFSIVSTVAEYCGPYLIRHSWYVLSPKSYIKYLKKALHNLEDAQRRLEHKVEDAKSSGYGIEPDVIRWLNDVKKHKADVEQLIGRRPGGILHPIDRHKLARDAHKGKEKIEGLCQKKKELEDKVSYHIHKPSGGTSSSAIKSFIINLKSRTSILNDVCKALEDEGAAIIGIHGMGGVGKSTLLKAIAESANDSGRFRKVEILTVSRTPNVIKLRADMVNLVNEAKVSDEDQKDKSKKDHIEEKRKIIIESEGKKDKLDNADDKEGADLFPTPRMKRVLIILDDLWEKIDLTGYVESSIDNDLKVQFILSSKNPDLLSSMNCQPNLQLNVLDEKEARELLARMVGKNVKLESIPEDQLTQSCAGLPLLIDALAQIIKRSSSPNPLEDALKQLPRNLDSVDTILELSYKQLDDPVKSLFSLCALPGRQLVQVQTLLGYSVGLGLFDDNDTIETAKSKMREWLKSLLGSSLLQADDDNSHVKIHDLVRDFAVKYAFKSHHALDGKDSSRLEIFISNAKASHDSNDDVKIVNNLAEKIDFKGRHFLVLKGDETALFISHAEACVEVPSDESFFQSLEKLKVLHLENMWFTGFPSLVESQPILKNLATLCLHNCYVKDITGIGNLKGLQVLSFSGSTIAKLPKQVGELTNLRSLNFSGCPKVEEIEPGALEKLSRLEELFLGRAFDKWEVESEAAHQRNASLAELNTMPYLATLDICIPNPAMLTRHLPFSQLHRYNIYIGEWDRSDEIEASHVITDPSNDNQVSRILKLNWESSRVLFAGWFQATLRRTQQLHLDGLNDDTKRSIHELCIGGFEKLKHLEVQNSPSTHYIIRSTEWFARSAFLSLEFLSLHSMMNLEKIGQGLLSPQSFGRLKILKVNNCKNLKSLFSLSSMRGLSQLKHIEVYECDQMQSVVVNERIENGLTQPEDAKVRGIAVAVATTSNIQKDIIRVTGDGKLIMPSLRHLTFERLPNFSSFFMVVDSRMLENVSEELRTSLRAFLFCDDQVALPKLTSLTLRSLEKLKEIWKITKSPMDLGALQSLEVERCNNLLNIFHPILVEKQLQKLESLTVNGCMLIQKVFDLEGLSSGSGKTHNTLPQLKEIRLMNLENLKYIILNKYPRELSGFQNLASLDVVRCGELEYLFTSSMTKAMKKLASINLEDCPKMKAVVKLEEAEHEKRVASTIEFPALKVLKIHQCPEMGRFSVQSTKQEEVAVSTVKDITSRHILATKGPKVTMRRFCLGYEDPDSTCKAISEEPITFFNKKVRLPSLEDLRLSSVGKFNTIWHNESTPAESFSKLASIEVSNCKELMTAFPASLLDRLEHLREVKILKCDSLKVLFELHTSNFTKRNKPVVFDQLKEVTISSLPKLEHVVEKDPKILVGFPSIARIDVSSCAMLRDLMPVATATTLSKLETLTLRNCSLIEEVVGGDDSDESPMDDIVFPLLSSLELANLENLICFCSASYQLDFPSMKKLSVENCMKMKIFIPGPTGEKFGFEDAGFPQSLFNEKVGLPKLEELRINEMNLEKLWSTEPFPGSFLQLKLLQVEWCNELQNVIPLFMLKRLQNLSSLTVNDCSKVEHIVAKADGRVAFPYLTYLKLETLEKLRGFCQGSEAIDLPSLKDLAIGECKSVDAIAAVKDSDIREDGVLEATATSDSNCSKIQIQQPLFWFDEKISIPSLEKLMLWALGGLRKIFYGHVFANSLCKLSEIDVRNCNNLGIMFQLNVLPSLTNLENLLIWNCKTLEVIYDFHELGGDDSPEVAAAAELRKLDLWGLPNLKHIWRHDPKVTVYIEKLSSVEVWSCRELSYIFPASAAKSLLQLKRLSLKRCGLKEIVGKGGETENAPSPKFIFPQLCTVEMDGLANLKSFYRGMYTVECPMLSELKIDGCSSVEVFSSDSTTFKREPEQGSRSPKQQQPLFLVDKDSFPLLKKLVISDSRILRRIWQHAGHVTACHFIKLRQLELYDCSGLEETLFPDDTVETFANLEVLRITDCESLRVIYDLQQLQGLDATSKLAAPKLRLKALHLRNLRKLEHVWNVGNDPKGSTDLDLIISSSFQNLSLVDLHDCESLKYLFPASVASSLLRLEKITASECSQLTEIIAQDHKLESADRPPKFLFPRVTSIQLSGLPQLKSLYPGPHISRWPLLTKLDISDCISIENFVNETQPSFFWVDKVTFRLLKELTLTWNADNKDEWFGQLFHPEFFPQLRVLKLKGFSGKRFHVPSSFLQHKLQIEKLTVSEASCEVVFQREEQVQQPKVACFTRLELNDLPEMINIWEENFEPASTFRNLESLQVSECAKLIKVLPSSISFLKLTSLAVSTCRGLKALMTLPTAKSLKQLSRMSIRECDALVEVVTSNGTANKDAITFGQLKYLELHRLERLTCFCSGKCKLNFPILQELVVNNCPWITSFSQRAFTADNLKTMQTEKGSVLVRDLNKTLRQRFEEQLASLETLDLFKSSVWREHWLEELPPRSLNKLKTLIVADDDRKLFPTAIPFDKALLLSNLQMLEVRNGDALRQVFDTRLETSNVGLRETMTLSFKKRIACFKNLRSISIQRCGTIRYALTTAMVLSLTQLREIRIGECGMLEEIVKKRLDHEVKDRKETTIEFPNLETIILEILPTLARFCQLDSQVALNCPSLKKIFIKNCCQMKTFASEFLSKEIPEVANEGRGEPTSNSNIGILQEPFFCAKVMFPSLEKLSLSNMDGLTKIWHGELPKESNNGAFVNFGNLELVDVYRCPQLKYLFPASVATSLLKLNKIKIKECNGLEEIIAAAKLGSEKAVERFVFPAVTILKLVSLPALNSFYAGIHTSEWPLLKELDVSGCPKVETLAVDIELCKRNPSEVLQVEGHVHDHIRTKQPIFLIGKDAFPNLERMIIHHMDNMKRVWHVIGEHDKMILTESLCQEMEQVVRRPEDDGGISFRRLENLKLLYLPSLVSFSSTSCTFFFPSLKRVLISGCPVMETFSDGLLLTSKQYKVDIQLVITKSDDDDDNSSDDDDDDDDDDDGGDDDEGEEHFQGDLNTAIQEQSKQMVKEAKKEQEEHHVEDADKGSDDIMVASMVLIANNDDS